MSVHPEFVANYLYVKPEEILNIYPYGSRVYGTASETSDEDLIVVFRDGVNLPEHGVFFFDYTPYTESQFEEKILAHEVSVLECLWLPPATIPKNERDFSKDFILDLPTLRESFSAKASNSFVKAKKKLTVEKDLNPYLAKKSLFHCLRILVFGMQIASYGRIINYAAANRFWYKIKGNKSERWEDYKAEWQPIYNRLSSAFRLLAPK